MLTPDERAALVVYCHDHAVAVCPDCSASLQVNEIGVDLILGRRDYCHRCRADITRALRDHLAGCTWMRVQGREVKASEGLRDRADVLAREAEVQQRRSRDVKRWQPSEGTGDP
jgi:hypothetical protein